MCFFAGRGEVSPRAAFLRRLLRFAPRSDPHGSPEYAQFPKIRRKMRVSPLCGGTGPRNAPRGIMFKTQSSEPKPEFDPVQKKVDTFFSRYLLNRIALKEGGYEQKKSLRQCV